jgi:hypothetical protein
MRHQRENTKRLRHKRLLAGLCQNCGKNPLHTKCLCKVCIAWLAKKNEEIKLKVFEAYGGFKCNCPFCDETNPLFLTIDHINNDGFRTAGKYHRAGIGLCRWLLKNNFPPGYQVLCFNCNCGRETAESVPIILTSKL